MAKLIIEGELSQLLKIQKAQRLLEARKIVKCTLEGNKDQESESSPVSETLPLKINIQINEEVEAKEKSVVIENNVEGIKAKQEPETPIKVNVQKPKGRPAKK